MSSPRAVWIDGPERLRVATTEPRAPARDEALVRVAYAGICGSDRDVLAGTRPACYVKYPIVPGHEWSGTITEIGTDVDPVLVGRDVVGEGFRACRTCPACRRGDTNLCAGPYAETGFTEPGAWADFLTLPAWLLHPLPAGTDLRAAAGLEPAACIAAACLLADARPGERTAVVGAGMLGLLAVQFLRAAGAAQIVAVDPNADRTHLATRSGANTLVYPETAEPDVYDAVIEAAGAPGTAALAAQLCRRGGRIVLTGLATDDRQRPDPRLLVSKQLTVHTVFGAPSRAWTHAVRALASGAIDPGMLVGREFALDDVRSAFEALESNRSNTVKALLVP